LGESKRAKKNWTSKLVTILVVGILLGLGLCGAGSFLSDQHSRAGDDFYIVGGICFWVSLLVLGITLILRFLFRLGNKDPR
jgi:hypothetical protein